MVYIKLIWKSPFVWLCALFLTCFLHQSLCTLSGWRHLREKGKEKCHKKKKSINKWCTGALWRTRCSKKTLPWIIEMIKKVNWSTNISCNRANFATEKPLVVVQGFSSVLFGTRRPILKFKFNTAGRTVSRHSRYSIISLMNMFKYIFHRLGRFYLKATMECKY